MTTALIIEGTPVKVARRTSVGTARYDGGWTVIPGELNCGHELTVAGDVYYEARDGRRWCIFCVHELERR